jgi:hypothetical protein
MKRVYFLATISALLRLIAGGAVGYYGAIGMLTGFSTPEGLAGLGFIYIGIVAMVIGGLLGCILATFSGLRWLHYEHAGRATGYTVGLFTLNLILSIFLFPLLLALPFMPPLAIYLANKAR